jgi:hydrogenase maturation protein HypF
VQHHHAHLAACLLENGAAGPALGVTWDGTGYGPDGTVWGGELLLGDAAGVERVASLYPFRLPGGEAAVREPRRTALALLWETLGEGALERADLAPVAAFTEGERRLLGRMLERGLNAPVTSSAGRLFDGIAALLDLGQSVSFEGQAAMALEWAADPAETGAYPLPLVKPCGEVGEWTPRWYLDWRPLVEALLADLARAAAREAMAARFHNALVEAVAEVARRLAPPRVALAGGCLQNRRLSQALTHQLREAGFEVLVHRLTPPNDGSLALGQVAVAAARLRPD